jgi:PAS domain S-box-containing protein
LSLNKRVNDQLREYQLMELRHVKERFEVQLTGFEELVLLTNRHSSQLANMRARHVSEHHLEKEYLRNSHESHVLQKFLKQHARELKRLSLDQRISVKQLKAKQNQRYMMNYNSVGAHAASLMGSSSASSAASSQSNSQCASRGESAASSARSSVLDVKDKINGGESELDEDIDGEAIVNIKSTKTTSKALILMIKRHASEVENLQKLNLQEINDFELEQEVKLKALDDKHIMEVNVLSKTQGNEIKTIKITQEKEIVMEEAMHDVEMKALLERKILGSVLDTVDNGIINITPNGTLTRFNKAAETIFQYKAEEVIGNNIKMLMTDFYAYQHDSFLNNYLTTGVKKVIGVPNGRRVTGLRKDGDVFPLQLSVSELKTEDSHMFTGIARDLTEQVTLEEVIEQEANAKKADMEKIIMQLDKSKGESDTLLSQMLPPLIAKRLMAGQTVVPETFDSATVFFLDIVGFSAICSKVAPLEIVSLMNVISQVIDTVIAQYDCYKVETIGMFC